MRNLNPLVFNNPWDLLEQQADEANFVVIDGLAIDVDDLIDAIHGRELDPILTRAELTTAYGNEYNTDFMERVDEGMKRRIRNSKNEKLRRIQALLKRSSIPLGNGIQDIKLPRREQILIALSKGRLRYSSLTEFLGQFAELTEKDAQNVVATVAEVRGDLAEVQAASISSSRLVREVANPQDLRVIESGLGIENLGQAPIFLLERAAFEIPPHEDDYQYFEEIRADRGVHIPFAIEGTLANAAFAAPLFTFVGGIISAQNGWIAWESLEPLFRPEFIFAWGGGAAVKVGQVFSKWTPLTNRLRASAHTRAVRKSATELKKMYAALEAALSDLKKTGIGSMKLLLLKEWILSLREGGQHQSNGQRINEWLTLLARNPGLAENFEYFAKDRLGDMDSIEGAQTLWQEFQGYQKAASSIPDVERSPAERARLAAAASRLKS